MKKWIITAIIAVTAILAGCDERTDIYLPEAHPEYAGTINGEGIPIAHFNIFYNDAYETLLFSLAEPHHTYEGEFMIVFDVVEVPGISRFMAIDDEPLITPFQKFDGAAELEMEFAQMGIDLDFMAQSIEIAFNSAVELHLVAGRAAEFGLSIADVDPHAIEMQLYTLEVMLEHPHIDVVAALGFTDETLRQFAELQQLYWLVYHYVANLLEVTDEELAQALEQHLYENPDFIEDWLETAPGWAGAEMLEQSFKREHERQLRDEYMRDMMEIWKSEVEIIRKVPYADFFGAIDTSFEYGGVASYLPEPFDDNDNYASYADAIVGTWELVSITGWDESDLELLGHWVETYFEDGTGEVRSDIMSSDFTWLIQENRLIMDDGMQVTTVNFYVTDSTFITFDPDSPEYPDGRWTFRRID